jgi:hypothetical protein
LNEVTVDNPPPPIEWTDEQVSIWLRVNYKNPNAQVPLAVAKKLADKRFCKDHDSVFVDRPTRHERITPEELCERLYGSLPMVAPSLGDPVYAIRDHEGRGL